MRVIVVVAVIVATGRQKLLIVDLMIIPSVIVYNNLQKRKDINKSENDVHSCVVVVISASADTNDMRNSAVSWCSEKISGQPPSRN